MRFLAFFLTFSLLHAEPPKFRTDTDGPVKGNEKRKVPKDRKPEDAPDWFQLVEGQFPPEGSAHAVTGELVHVGHLDRQFQIRVDRNDSQDRAVWDLPLDATLLPYGSIWYQGAPAALQDIPLGTHLHGLFYLTDPEDKTPLPDTWYKRKTPEWEFRRCFRIEDEFSFHARQQQRWKIDSVDLATKKLTATLQDKGKPSGQPKIFDLLSSTRVFKGQGIVDLKALQPGQTILFNLTWVTLYGPGRITDVWLDEASRALVTANQLERHRNHIRERGLPAWVTEVDDEQQFVTVMFFGNVDAKLFDELKIKDPNLPPPKDGSPPPVEPRGGLAVACETLMTYDPVNDRKTGSILEVNKLSVEPGGSGVQMKIKMDMMLEGYRPKRIVRFYPETWKVIALPKEEEYFGKE
ncbi:MAG: hypothetical protein K9N47_05285 [Prosthecobacter sp.]|uniref:hypothetical protein n=1 Tax=Prosthecobacter sp. TaxID=1965333 RepID=UPI0025D9946A|nr:hypothetical protein [Prosthecobacter sp.]MCF7785513.1 hypothetical protein [Prosthecobacter sp.]